MVEENPLQDALMLAQEAIADAMETSSADDSDGDVSAFLLPTCLQQFETIAAAANGSAYSGLNATTQSLQQ